MPAEPQLESTNSQAGAQTYTGACHERSRKARQGWECRYQWQICGACFARVWIGTLRRQFRRHWCEWCAGSAARHGTRVAGPNTRPGAAKLAAPLNSGVPDSNVRSFGSWLSVSIGVHVTWPKCGETKRFERSVFVVLDPARDPRRSWRRLTRSEPHGRSAATSVPVARPSAVCMCA